MKASKKIDSVFHTLKWKKMNSKTRWLISSWESDDEFMRERLGVLPASQKQKEIKAGVSKMRTRSPKTDQTFKKEFGMIVSFHIASDSDRRSVVYRSISLRLIRYR